MFNELDYIRLTRHPEPNGAHHVGCQAALIGAAIAGWNIV